MATREFRRSSDERLDRRLIVAVDRATSDRIDEVCGQLRVLVSRWVRRLLKETLDNDRNGTEK